jgi:hypothetical protein
MTPKLLNSHRLAIGGAHHLHEAGHITADQKDKFQAGSRKVLAQNKAAPPKQIVAAPPPRVPFGAMAPAAPQQPQMAQQPQQMVRPPMARP